MKRKKINWDLSIRIHNYLEYKKKGEQKMNNSEEKRIINKLSLNLREELFQEANGKIVNDIKLFSFNFNKNISKINFFS